MKNLSSSQFPSETGCLFQCSKTRYKLKEVKVEDLKWKTEWISEVDQYKIVGVRKKNFSTIRTEKYRSI